MLKRVATRVAALLLAILPVLVQPIPTPAASNDTVFAVRNGNQIVIVDPGTGAETLVADAVPTTPGPLFAIDGDPNIYGLGTTCFCGGRGGAIVTQAITFNTITDQIAITPDMALTVYGGIAFDPNTKNLYGLTLFQAACCTSTLERIDPATGSETAVAQVPFASPYIDALAIDSTSGILYLTYGSDPFSGHSSGPRAILAVNLNTGMITTSPVLAEELASLVFDAKKSALYGVTVSQKLVVIDPASGLETPVATFPTGSSVSSPVLEPKSHTLLGIAGGPPDRLVSVNIRNGAMTFGPSLAGGITSLAVQRLVGSTN